MSDGELFPVLYRIEQELPLMKWEKNPGNAGGLSHFTGRGPKWTVQLVTLDNGQRMGAASAGTVVCRLTDELAKKAEELARGST